MPLSSVQRRLSLIAPRLKSTGGVSAQFFADYLRVLDALLFASAVLLIT